MVKIDPSEITPKSLYLSRRQFIGSAGAALVGAIALAACKGNLPSVTATEPPYTGATADELGAPLTSYQDITHYNNYYRRGRFGRQFPHLPVEHRGLRASQ
jgi:sulfoxide reductase catalytic subunit YedY